MKTETTVQFVLRLSVTLVLICAVVAVALAGVNSITAPKIAQLNAEKIQTAIETVLPGGGNEVDFSDATGLVNTVYEGANGYAVEVAPAGFGGTITMMVGVDTSGNVLGISVVSQSETAGLGAIIAATTSAGEAFRGQFEGVGGTIAVTKDGGQIDSITGATITSRAVCVGVQAALDCVASMG